MSTLTQALYDRLAERIREDPGQDAVEQTLAALSELSQIWSRANVEALVKAAFHAAHTTGRNE